MSIKNTHNQLYVACGNAPFSSFVCILIKRFGSDLTIDALVVEVITDALVQLFLKLRILTVDGAFHINIYGILFSVGREVAEVICGLREDCACFLNALAFKVDGCENDLTVLIDGVCRNNVSILIGKQFDFGVDTKADVGQRFLVKCGGITVINACTGSKCADSENRYE